MWILLILFSLSSFALEPFEQVSKVKILKVLPKNIVLVDHGLEDGLSKNDHIKFVNETEGFSSRAICVRSSATTSYWKLYRIPSTEAFSMDYTYTLVGLSDREIPFPPAQFRHTDIEVNDNPPAKRATGANPFDIKRDLPERLTERDLLENVGLEKRKLFIEQALDRDRLRRDLAEYQFSFYASPFTRQSINDGESLRYGFRGANVGNRYRLITQFEQQQTKLRDPFTKETVSTRNTSGQVQFVINRLTDNFSSLSLVNYYSQNFSKLGTPDQQYQVGLLGFTWHLYESKTWESLDLSYIPLYDVRYTEIEDATGTGTVKDTGLRHGFRLGMRNKINERVSFENLLWVKPYQDFTDLELDTQDLNLSNDLKLILNITKNLFLDYNLIFQKDYVLKKLSGLPESNTINSLNVRLDVSL